MTDSSCNGSNARATSYHLPVGMEIAPGCAVVAAPEIVVTERIALISEHASPLAVVRGTDNRGQNIYVANIARNLASCGIAVDVFTRRDSPDLPDVLASQAGVRVFHVPAGPAAWVPKEDLLPYMGEFAAWMVDWFQRVRYDLVHANFFLSGLVALALKRALGTPFVITFHALGLVHADRFPVERVEIEEKIVREADGIIAECPQDYSDLTRLYGADARRLCIIPCGFETRQFLPVARKLAPRVRRGRAPARIPHAVLRRPRHVHHHAEVRAFGIVPLGNQFTWPKVTRSLATFYDRVVAEAAVAAQSRSLSR